MWINYSSVKSLPTSRPAKFCVNVMHWSAIHHCHTLSMQPACCMKASMMQWISENFILADLPSRHAGYFNLYSCNWLLYMLCTANLLLLKLCNIILSMRWWPRMIMASYSNKLCKWLSTYQLLQQQIFPMNAAKCSQCVESACSLLILFYFTGNSILANS